LDQRSSCSNGEGVNGREVVVGVPGVVVVRDSEVAGEPVAVVGANAAR
jgi:hypothetical protein